MGMEKDWWGRTGLPPRYRYMRIDGKWRAIPDDQALQLERDLKAFRAALADAQAALEGEDRRGKPARARPRES